MIACATRLRVMIPHARPRSPESVLLLAVGMRPNPFSTLPAFNTNYWPSQTKLIHVDINEARISLTMPVTMGIHGNESMVAQVAASGYMQLRWRVVVQGPRC